MTRDTRVVLRKGSTNGSTFTPLYNGIEDSYGVDSIGYWCVIGVLEGNTTPVGVTSFNLRTQGFFGYEHRISNGFCAIFVPNKNVARESDFTKSDTIPLFKLLCRTSRGG